MSFLRRFMLPGIIAGSPEGGRKSRTAAAFLLAVTVLGFAPLAGCGQRPDSDTASVGGAPAAQAPPSARTAEGAAGGGFPGGGGGAADTGTPKAQPVANVPRKIIYTATVEIVAENLTGAQQALLELAKARGGFIAGSEIEGASGSSRTGSWTVRVPVEQYEAFMDAVARLGEMQSMKTDSQDVTEEFYDIEARLTNKRVEEARLVAHLKQSTAKLQDILAVEREISRVRGEIERMEGRLRLLANQSDLTTVTVTIREVENYQPPRPAGFATQIARAFGGSLGAMRDFAKVFTLLAVALIPWLLLLAAVSTPFWLLMRRRRNGRQIRPPASR